MNKSKYSKAHQVHSKTTPPLGPQCCTHTVHVNVLPARYHHITLSTGKLTVISQNITIQLTRRWSSQQEAAHFQVHEQWGHFGLGQTIERSSYTFAEQQTSGDKDNIAGIHQLDTAVDLQVDLLCPCVMYVFSGDHFPIHSLSSFGPFNKTENPTQPAFEKTP